MSIPQWIPSIIELKEFSGNWEIYLENLYAIFTNDFIKSKPKFNDTELNIKRHPKTNEKEATFWHLISTGKIEEDREPDLRRCERICWPKPIIENSNDTGVKIWRNKRKGETRILLWFEAIEYLVVLAERTGYLLFWTAYPVIQDHSKRKLNKEYEQYQKYSQIS